MLTNSLCPFDTRAEHKTWVSLPGYFRQNGFDTIGMGKIFHENTCEGAAVGERAAAWSVKPYYHAPCISLGSIYNHTCYESFPGPLPEGPGGKVTSVYANATAGSAEDMPDGMIAAEAVRVLRARAAAARASSDKSPSSSASSASSASSPFFMAVGFHKPHLPHIAPAEFFDLYPLSNVSLPAAPSRKAPQGSPPSGVWNACGEWKSYKDNAAAAKYEKFARDVPLGDEETRRQRRAYYAAASFVDAQIGKVLTELKATGLDKTTVVALWGDHGVSY